MPVRMVWYLAFSVILISANPPGLGAQTWNDARVVELVSRAAERRIAPRRDSQLVQYRSTARGVVLYLARLGDHPGTPPRLLKTDQLEAEVYWRAPNRSKQVIRRWRERIVVPTGIRYHRDHLGIVVDEFGGGDRIRLGGGEGDEVRDLVHPVSPAGLDHYVFALADSLELQAGGASIRVHAVLVRPARADGAGLVGVIHLDAVTGDLVRLEAGFTAASYRQASLEDITLVLENALHDGRFWLPYRQRIEIRRRVSWLDFPFQTVIRAHWEIGDYDLETAVTDQQLAGGPWGGPPAALPDTGWDQPIESAGRAALRAGEESLSLEGLRSELVRELGADGLRPAPPARPAFGSLSDLVRVNRVQGLVTGIGATLRIGDLTLRPRMARGWSDRRFTGGVSAEAPLGEARVVIGAERQIVDYGAWPVASGVLSSFLAQESGGDLGDWVMVDRGGVWGRWNRGASQFGVGLDLERSTTVEARALPVSGELRPNPALGIGTVMVARGVFRGGGLDASAEVALGRRSWGRIQLSAERHWAVGPGVLRAGIHGGAGTGGLPAWRGFPIGGRGTLVGEPWRSAGGRAAVVGRVGWELPVSLADPGAGLLAAGLGQFTLTPFMAAGWAGGALPPVDGVPAPSEGVRPVLGMALDLLFGGLRLEAGWSPRARRVGLVLDASPAWWPVL